MARVRDQILGGLRLIRAGVIGLLLLFGMVDGFLRFAEVVRGGSAALGGLIGVGELLAIGAVLLTKAHVWSRWVVAIALLGALKGIIGLIAGTTLSPPFRQFPRLVAVETLGYLLVGGILSLRFVSEVPRAHERVALTVFVFATCADMLFEPSHVALMVGLSALVIARVATVVSRSR